MGSAGIVDGHVHVADSPLADAGGRPVRSTVEWLVESMSDAGAGQAVLVQPSILGPDHRYLLDCLTRYPRRFAAVVTVPPTHPEHLTTLLAADGSDGIAGVRMTPLMTPDIDWFGPGSEPLMRIVAAHRLTVSLLLHPTQLEAAAAWIDQHPEVVVVVDHLARPDLAERPRDHAAALVRLAGYPTVRIRISALQQLSVGPDGYPGLAAVAQAVLTAYGPERLIWGSDFPYVRPDGYRASLDALDLILPDLAPDARTAILGSTARQVFRLPDPITVSGGRPAGGTGSDEA
jgi:predicted TIM-barrel fold metal-dependent hydrolase